MELIIFGIIFIYLLIGYFVVGSQALAMSELIKKYADIDNMEIWIVCVICTIVWPWLLYKKN